MERSSGALRAEDAWATTALSASEVVVVWAQLGKENAARPNASAAAAAATTVRGVGIAGAAVALAALRKWRSCSFSKLMCSLVCERGCRTTAIDMHNAGSITPLAQRSVDWTMVLPDTFGSGTA